jgi:hypothetical protein
VATYSLTSGTTNIDYTISEFTFLNDTRNVSVTLTFKGMSGRNDPYYGMLSLRPSSPFTSHTKEVVLFGPFNAFSSIWAVIAFCITLVTVLFPTSMPPIDRYFGWRTVIKSLFCCCAGEKTHRISLDDEDKRLSLAATQSHHTDNNTTTATTATDAYYRLSTNHASSSSSSSSL